jgi:hypothetical protein
MADGAEFLVQVFQLILGEDGVKGGGGIDVLVAQALLNRRIMLHSLLIRLK